MLYDKDIRLPLFDFLEDNYGDVRILEEKQMDDWSHNKAIQKARESYRITPAQKEYLKTLKV